MCAHALLRGHQQIGCIEPLVQRDFAALHERADGHGELAAARVAHVEARSRRLALDPCSLIQDATMRTNRTIGPKLCFKPFAGESFVLKNWVFEVGSHGNGPSLD